MAAVKDYLSKGNSFQLGKDVDEIKRFSSVDIVYTKDDGSDDETSFDVEDILSSSGANDLDDCFDNFCKENEITDPVVTNLVITCTADTYGELIDLSK